MHVTTSVQLGTALPLLPAACCCNCCQFCRVSLNIKRRQKPCLQDNVLRDGRVLDLSKDTVPLQGVRACNIFAKADPRTETLILCLSDGVTICRKL